MSNKKEKFTGVDANSALLPVSCPATTLKVEEEEDKAPVIVEQSKFTSFPKKKSSLSDIKLLKEMFSIYSPSGDEHSMVAYVSSYLTANDIEHKIDSVGNIYFKNHIEGVDRVIVNAHMDTVANAVADVGVFKTADDVVFKSKNNQVIGGDDKCGVFAVLKLITDRNFHIPLTGLLTVAEETGCNGVRHAMKYHLDYFGDCIFWITIDRRGNDEIITTNSDYQLCSSDISNFLNDLDDNWETSTGSISDVSDGVVALQINGINLAAGYYNAHTGSEYVSLNDLNNSINFCKAKLIPETQRHLSSGDRDAITWEPTQAYNTYSYGGYGGYGGVKYYGFKPPINAEDPDDWDIFDDVEEKLAEVIEDIERIEGYMVLDDLVDLQTSLTKSKKNLRVIDAYTQYEAECDVLARHLTCRRDGNDLLLEMASIEGYKTYKDYVSEVKDEEGDWY